MVLSIGCLQWQTGIGHVNIWMVDTEYSLYLCPNHTFWKAGSSKYKSWKWRLRRSRAKVSDLDAWTLSPWFLAKTLSTTKNMRQIWASILIYANQRTIFGVEYLWLQIFLSNFLRVFFLDQYVIVYRATWHQNPITKTPSKLSMTKWRPDELSAFGS